MKKLRRAVAKMTSSAGHTKSARSSVTPNTVADQLDSVKISAQKDADAEAPLSMAASSSIQTAADAGFLQHSTTPHQAAANAESLQPSPDVSLVAADTEPFKPFSNSTQVAANAELPQPSPNSNHDAVKTEPSSALNPDFLGRAVAVVKKAVEADSATRFEDAYKLYNEAIELLFFALKWEKSLESKSVIRTRVTEYIDRAEAIHNFLDSQLAHKPENKSLGSSSNISAHSDGARIRRAISDCILQRKPDEKWEDVAGLSGAKELLQLVFVLPHKFRNLYSKKDYWTTVLMFGPHGCGKSTLAMALTTCVNVGFFDVDCRHIHTEWADHGPEYIRELFQLARKQAPAIIFLDYIDVLYEESQSTSRSHLGYLKHQLEKELRVANAADRKEVMVLCTATRPWLLSWDILMHLQRKVHVDLPSCKDREQLLKLRKPSNWPLTPADYAYFVEQTEGFSGEDVDAVVSRVETRLVSLVDKATHYKAVVIGGQEKFTPCSPEESGAIEMDWTDIDSHKLCSPFPTRGDMERAIKTVDPSSEQEYLVKCREWAKRCATD